MEALPSWRWKALQGGSPSKLEAERPPSWKRKALQVGSGKHSKVEALRKILQEASSRRGSGEFHLSKHILLWTTLLEMRFLELVFAVQNVFPLHCLTVDGCNLGCLQAWKSNPCRSGRPGSRASRICSGIKPRIGRSSQTQNLMEDSVFFTVLFLAHSSRIELIFSRTECFSLVDAHPGQKVTSELHKIDPNSPNNSFWCVTEFWKLLFGWFRSFLCNFEGTFHPGWACT